MKDLAEIMWGKETRKRMLKSIRESGILDAGLIRPARAIGRKTKEHSPQLPTVRNDS